MNKILAFFAIVLLSGYSVLVTAAPTHQVALVIGNGNYEYEALSNPVNDAVDMAKNLRKLGFRVDLQTNLKHKEMKKVIRAFGKRLDHTSGADIGVFYYSGHGTYDDHNYLIPIKNRGIRRDNLKYKAVSDQQILAEMGRFNKDGVNIFILDACRDEPHPGSRKKGLTRKGLTAARLSKDMVMALAAAAGQVADDRFDHRNSLYTEHLLKKLESARGKRISEVFMSVRQSVAVAEKGNNIPVTVMTVADVCFGGCFE
jgi:uncharacterized caspase-like protein